MKRLIMVNGTMGVGKTTTCLELQKLLPKNVFLDGDWCWSMNPFIVTEETKRMVAENIVYQLNNFIKCSEFENIIFCWVMHQQVILHSIIERLNISDCELHIFSLICSESALKARLEMDIAHGKRSEDILERSLSRMKNYDAIDSIKVDVSNISPFDAAVRIKEMMEVSGYAI